VTLSVTVPARPVTDPAAGIAQGSRAGAGPSPSLAGTGTAQVDVVMLTVALPLLLACADAPVARPVLTLAAALARSETSSPRLRAAAAVVDEIQAETKVATRWWSDPQLQLGYNAAPAHPEGEANLDVALQQELRWPMESWARAARGTASTVVATQEQSQVALLVWRDVVVAYVDLVAAQEALAVQQQLSDVARRVSAAAHERVSAGQSAPLEAAFADVDAAAAAAAVQAARGAVAQARASLCRDMGSDDCADDDVVWPVIAVPVLARGFAGAGSDAERAAAVDSLMSRPDVAAAVAGVDSARADVNVSHWQRVPAPTFGLTLTQQRSEFVVAGDIIHDDVTLVGLRLSLPLPLWSFGQGDVAVREAGQRRAEAERDLVHLRAVSETRAAVAGWQASVDALRSWNDVDNRCDESLGWLQDGYRKGVVDLDAMLNGRDRIARARLAAIAARRAEVVAAAQVFLALGHKP